MGDRAIATTCSVTLFVVATAVAFAGADRPPPLGFFVLVVALGALSVVARLRLLAHLRALGARRWGRFGRVALEGLVAGSALAAFLVLISTGEPSVTPGPIDLAIWFLVAAAAGSLATLAVWAVALGLRVLGSRQQGGPTRP